jgi:hypothetical protein
MAHVLSAGVADKALIAPYPGLVPYPGGAAYRDRCLARPRVGAEHRDLQLTRDGGTTSVKLQ